nr:helix-turn-helix transcriptional regulator [Dyella sp. ASV24]
MEKVTAQKRLAQVIRVRREAMDISQESFADSIGMHRAYYSTIERGERNMTIETLLRVSDGLGTTMAELAQEAGI